MLIVGCLSSAPAQVPPPSEASLRVGFVYNFGKFTEWPAQSLPAGQVMLCLAGPDVQGAVATIEGRVIQGRTVRVRRVSRPDELKGCQMAYLTDLDERRVTDLLRAVRGQPVLTVGDVEGFVDLGGMIGLGLSAGRVHFDINQEAVQAGGLKLSSQLLRLARAVKGSGS